LSDDEHLHHSMASEWWASHRNDGWASCPLTQNGLVRVVSSANYRRPKRLADALAQLSGLLSTPTHAFWPDDMSLADPAVFDHGHILGPNQITDVYLLALAVKNGGRLVTLDRGIPLRAVRGAEARHLVVI
jgi:toxin-antitoxin system PIN domain toxin